MYSRHCMVVHVKKTMYNWQLYSRLLGRHCRIDWQLYSTHCWADTAGQIDNCTVDIVGETLQDRHCTADTVPVSMIGLHPYWWTPWPVPHCTNFHQPVHEPESALGPQAWRQCPGCLIYFYCTSGEDSDYTSAIYTDWINMHSYTWHNLSTYI